MFSGIGFTEVIVVVLIVLLLFGAKKIPELARGIGQGIQEFKKATGEIRKEIERGASESEDVSKKNETTKTH